MDPIIEGKAQNRDTSYHFLELLDDLREIEQGIPYRSFEDLSKQRNLDTEFKLLKKITETKTHAALLVPNEAELHGQNRYSDILPYVDTAVPLRSGEYINASFVSAGTSEGVGKIIATQGPLPATKARFWEMVCEQDVSSIIMISALNEAGKAKCDQYFPLSSPLEVGGFHLSMGSERQIFPNLTLRVVNVETEDGISKTVQHLQSTAWPDHGSPDLDEEWPALSHLLEVMKTEQSSGRTVVVHCSAGIGRTGTIIALHEILNSLNAQLARSLPNPRVSVFGTVRRLREERWGMVQNRDQYSFIYKFATRYIDELLTESPGAFIE